MEFDSHNDVVASASDFALIPPRTVDDGSRWAALAREVDVSPIPAGESRAVAIATPDGLVDPSEVLLAFAALIERRR